MAATHARTYPPGPWSVCLGVMLFCLFCDCCWGSDLDRVELLEKSGLVGLVVVVVVTAVGGI